MSKDNKIILVRNYLKRNYVKESDLRFTYLRFVFGTATNFSRYIGTTLLQCL